MSPLWWKSSWQQFTGTVFTYNIKFVLYTSLLNISAGDRDIFWSIQFNTFSIQANVGRCILTVLVDIGIDTKRIELVEIEAVRLDLNRNNVVLRSFEIEQKYVAFYVRSKSEDFLNKS